MKTSTRITIILLVLCAGAFAGWMVVKINHSHDDLPIIDINLASFEELDALPYVSPVSARGIIDQRPFLRVDDLIRVSGIGEKTLEHVRPYVKVE